MTSPAPLDQSSSYALYEASVPVLAALASTQLTRLLMPLAGAPLAETVKLAPQITSIVNRSRKTAARVGDRYVTRTAGEKFASRVADVPDAKTVASVQWAYSPKKSSEPEVEHGQVLDLLPKLWRDPSLYANVPEIVPEQFKPPLPEDAPSGLRLVDAWAEREILGGYRDAVDQGANVMDYGYRRVANPNGCPFCKMLATRTKLYRTKESAREVVGREGSGRTRGTQSLGDGFHNGCKCKVIMVPRSQAKTLTGDALQYDKIYRAISTRSRNPKVIMSIWRMYDKLDAEQREQFLRAVSGDD